MREWWSKVARLFGGRGRLAAELREEIETHLQLEIEDNLSRGMSPEQAAQAARRGFGNTTLIEEGARDSWAFCLLETFLQDLRYGARAFLRSPGFTTTALLSLALGIGANSALFSMINTVMLCMLPVKQPERLLLLNWHAKAWPEKVVEDVEGNLEKDEKTGLMTSSSFSSAFYEYLTRNNSVFSATLASACNDARVNLGLGGRAEDAMLQAVSGDFFLGLGVSPVMGRVLLPDDDRPGVSPAVVASYAFWQGKLGGDMSAAGREIVINGKPATVVGVAPREFFGVEPGRVPDLFVPLSFEVQQYRQNYGYDLQQPKVWWLTLLGRLKPGVSPEQARIESRVLFQRSLGGEGMPGTDLPWLELTPAGRGLNSLREEFSTSLLLLMAMVGVVLLIACANIAGLLLARATVRAKEISVRLSLGAPRVRIVRQLLTESILLGVLGGAIGLLFAGWVGSSLTALFATAPRQPITLSIQPDLRVFGFTAVISVLCGILFGLAPALRASRVDVYTALRQTGGVSTYGGHRFLSGKILVGVQVAFALLLLVGAGLLVGTLQRLRRVDLGFNQQRLLLFEVQPGLNGYKGERLSAYYGELQRRLGTVPGVRSVGLSQRGPVEDGWSQGRVVLPGYTAPGKSVPFYRQWVSPGFFGTLEIPLILGRVIGPQDLTSAPKAVVVNQRFVRDYFHGDNPIGRQFMEGSQAAGEIVGVVGDARYGSLRSEAPPTAYRSYLQYPRDYPASMMFEVRTDMDPNGLSSLIRGEAAAIDKNIPLVRMRTETQTIEQALFLEKIFALLSTSFGFLALLLSCVGLFGTMSYLVTRRTNEIGIRMALGAERMTIRRMVLRETFWIVSAGILVGLPVAWLGTRLLESRLFGLSPHDPATILLATAAIFAVTLLAGYLPARRASRVDPIVALRCE